MLILKFYRQIWNEEIIQYQEVKANEEKYWEWKNAGLKIKVKKMGQNKGKLETSFIK